LPGNDVEKRKNSEAGTKSITDITQLIAFPSLNEYRGKTAPTAFSNRV
jgi:hypothetical protein